MTKEQWIPKIKTACEDAGTYRPFFDDLINSLANLLSLQDRCLEQLQGAPLLIERTNKGGYTSMIKNPAFAMFDEVSRTALTYWKELGLTPAGFRRIRQRPLGDQDQQGRSRLEQLRAVMEEA